MNYIGSKNKLAAFIIDQIEQVVGVDLSEMVFAEIFGGTGIIARRLKTKVKQVIVSDVESYSYILLRNYIGNTNILDLDLKILQLNQLPLLEGFVYENYCLGSGSERLYFSDENGKKIDAIRTQIEQWKKQKELTKDEYYFLLASLLESAVKVANTASVYGAFLKKLKKTAQKTLQLKAANFDISTQRNLVFQQNANQLIKEIEGDILYLDPPYNARQYGANYHLLNTIALYDDFTPKGKTGLRDYERSVYCKKNEVLEQFEQLIQDSRFRYIFVSYNNEGLMSLDQIRSVMEKYGDYRLATIAYQRFKADRTENRNHKAVGTFEYLHILEKPQD